VGKKDSIMLLVLKKGFDFDHNEWILHLLGKLFTAKVATSW